MSQPPTDDQAINFGSDLSFTACVENCLDGECCDCDDHRQSADNAGGQHQQQPGQDAAPYQHQQPTARASLLSLASSGRGPSQPRPITAQQPYQPQHPMYYGATAASYAGYSNVPQNYGGYDGAWSYDDRAASYSGYPEEQHGGAYFQGYGGGLFIAPQYPPGFTTQASSYPEGMEVTPVQASWGWYRDGAGRLCNGEGKHITERGEVIQPSASSGVPQSFPPLSHGSGSSGAGGSQAGSRQGHSGGRKHKDQ